MLHSFTTTENGEAGFEPTNVSNSQRVLYEEAPRKIMLSLPGVSSADVQLMEEKLWNATSMKVSIVCL